MKCWEKKRNKERERRHEIAKGNETNERELYTLVSILQERDISTAHTGNNCWK
jgi:hypothetical protein